MRLDRECSGGRQGGGDRPDWGPLTLGNEVESKESAAVGTVHSLDAKADWMSDTQGTSQCQETRFFL